MGMRLGDAEDPLLVSVRSGAKFSMPGMMDTVLNLGLNGPLGRGPGPQERQPPLRLGLLPALPADVRLGRAGPGEERLRGAPRRVQEEEEGEDRPGPRRRRPAGAGEAVQGPGPPAHRPRVPAGAARAAGAGARRRVPLVDERPRHLLPAPEPHPRRHRHRRQRAGDGVRQHGRELGHRRRLHPQPGHRREPLLRRVPDQRPGRGRGRRRAHAVRHQRRLQERAEQDLPTLEQLMPTSFRELREITSRLEQHYRDVQDFEFTIEDGRLFLLQTRNGKRTDAGRGADRGGHGGRGPDHEGGGAAARRAHLARPAAPPAPRPEAEARRSSRRASPPRRARPSGGRSSTPTPRPSAGTTRARSSWCARRPRPTTSTAWTRPRAS